MPVVKQCNLLSQVSMEHFSIDIIENIIRKYSRLLISLKVLWSATFNL